MRETGNKQRDNRRVRKGSAKPSGADKLKQEDEEKDKKHIYTNERG
jgi:hypothetical protein